MNAQEVQQQFEKTLLELETASLQVGAENQSDERLYRAEVAGEQISKRSRELFDKAVVRFAGVEWLIDEREKELTAKAGVVQRPLAHSGDAQKILISQNYDSRAREFVSMVEDPARVVTEIEANLSNPDYSHSLIDWARLKFGEGPRSKLGIAFDQVVDKFQDAIGVNAINAELQALKEVRTSVTTRREIAEAGIYRVDDEDRREAERMGLDVEAALKIKALRLKRRQQKAALQAH